MVFNTVFRGPKWLTGKCLTCSPGVLGSSHTGSSGFFRGSVLGQDTSEPQPSTGETQERHNVNCNSDMTEILLKAVYNTNQTNKLTLFSTVFQLYCDSQCTYPCCPGILFTSTRHNILSKPLASFPHNQCRNNGWQ